MSEGPAPRASLDLLRGFEAAARHLSFTLAAQELFVTQSAVSRQIKTLEAQLGVQLFTRQARGIALTEPGERLYRTVSSALSQVHEAIAALSGTAPRTVTVTCTMSFCTLWLIPRLTSFQSANPGVEVHISASNEVVNLDRSRLDLAIRYAPPHRAPAGAIRLFGEEVAPVCAPSLAKDRARPLKRIEDLARHVLLHLDEPMGPLPWLSWSTWLEAAGASAVHPAGSMHFNHYDSLIRAALAGQGIALGRMPLLAALVEDGSLVRLFPNSAASNRAYWVVAGTQAGDRPEVQAFVQWLSKESAEQVSRQAGEEGKGARARRGR